MDGFAFEPEPMTSFEAGVAREHTRNALFGTVAQQRKIHRYTVLERIGAGAMGVVYAAYDPDLDRRVAIKLLRTPDTSAASPARDRILAEARALPATDRKTPRHRRRGTRGPVGRVRLAMSR